MNFSVGGQSLGLLGLVILTGGVGVVLIVLFGIISRGVIPAVEEPLETRRAEDEGEV